MNLCVGFVVGDCLHFKWSTSRSLKKIARSISVVEELKHCFLCQLHTYVTKSVLPELSISMTNDLKLQQRIEH